MADTPAGCCELCGVHLGGKPHTVTLSAQGALIRRYVVCVRCRAELMPAATTALDKAAGALRSAA